MDEFQEAVRLEPAHAEAYNNLGAMQHVVGDLDRAATYYRRGRGDRAGQRRGPEQPGTGAGTQGQHAAAAVEYRAALALRAGHGVGAIRAGLGAGHVPGPGGPEPSGGDPVGRAGVAVTGRNDATALDALAAAYASAGRFDQASTTARAALEVATRTKAEALAARIRARLAAYERAVKR